MASIKSKTDWISVFAVAKKSDWWRNVVYLVKVDPFRIRVSLWCPALFDIWLNCFQFFFTRLSLTFHTYVSTTISFFCLFPSGLIFFLSTRVAKKKKEKKKGTIVEVRGTEETPLRSCNYSSHQRQGTSSYLLLCNWWRENGFSENGVSTCCCSRFRKLFFSFSLFPPLVLMKLATEHR